MKHAITRSTARKALFAALLLAAVLGVIAPVTEAAPPPNQLCTYYDDFGNVVGQSGSDCCGNKVEWGIVTRRAQCYVENCIWCPPTE